MVEKRLDRRYPKRLQVRYGDGRSVRTAFTGDISEEGLFIRTARVNAPRSRLQVELTTPERQTVTFEGEVRWAKRVPPNLVHLAHKGGMGIRISRFIEGGEHYAQLCSAIRSRMA